MFLAILCVAIAAPTFAGEYQTGGDSILRAAKYGRTRLAVTKILAAQVLFIVTFLVGITVHLLILNTAFGTDCLKTSFQMHNQKEADRSVREEEKRKILERAKKLGVTIIPHDESA